MLQTVNRNPSPRELRTFALTIFIGLGVIGVLLWWVTGEEGDGWAWTARWQQWVAVTLWLVGVLAAAVTVMSASLGRGIYVGWMTVAMAIGMVMVPVFLSVLFFVLLPIFALYRFKDPLRLKLNKEGSYWEPHRPHEATLERTMRPF